MTPISAMSTTDPARASETEFPIPISADFPEAAAGLVAGQVLCNRYRVGEWIGGGGMADVFSGTDGWLARPVAIKVIKPAIATREMCRRMEQEGRAAAAIDHPNLLRVLDIGTLGRTVFLVTELLFGRSLAQLLRERPNGRLPWRLALELLIPALDALHYVHRAGYVHRDLKPDNLFFHSDDRSERLIVLDLGIAKLARGEYVDKTTYHTESGRVLGTPAYMSPEQASGLPLDRRTDIYSIGVTLHRMLAGRLPFESEQGDRPLQLMARNIYDEPPRLDERALGLPSRLADVVLRTLAKAPGQRPAHMSELAEALSECLAEPDPRPATADFSRSGRVARVAGIAAGVAILGALVVSPGAGSPAGRALVVADEPHTSAAAPRPPALAVASQPAAPAVVETLAATAELVPAAEPSAAPTSLAPPASRPGSRRASALRAVLTGVAPDVAECLDRYGDPDRRALRVRLALTTAGAVSRAELLDEDAALLGRCVRATLARLHFGPGPAQRFEHSYAR